MSQNTKSVKEEILDRFELRIEENEDIPGDVVALLKADRETDSLPRDDEVREVIEQVVSADIEVSQNAD